MVSIDQDPYADLDAGKDWIIRGIWPCKWTCCTEAGDPPFVTAYRLRFALAKNAHIRAHVSADERYELFLDGERIGRGSERGDAASWFYETYELDLSKGDHSLVARVWSLGKQAPYAQMSLRPGFIFSPEGEFVGLLGTGVAQWEAKKLSGYEFTDPFPAWGTGANLVVDGAAFCWGFEEGEGEGWKPAQALHEGSNASIRNEYPPIHLMRPRTLPEMLEREIHAGRARFVSEPSSDDTSRVAVDEKDSLVAELDAWHLTEWSGPVEVPPDTTCRVIIDLEEYYCAYPELVTSGGAGSTIRIRWAESLHETAQGESKGNRDEIHGKYFRGVGDVFKPDGGRHRRFETLWWQAGRYLELLIRTGQAPLTIESLRLRETRYPMEMESAFESSDPRLAGIIPMTLRALQMCSHETYLDCPYYEQLMYAGDTRIQALTAYAVTRDDRLTRKALCMFDVSRLSSGIVQSRYPSRVTQVLPPFALWWIGMVYDYALWRDDPSLVKELMPGVRAVIDFHLRFVNESGLIQAPAGWSFMDWVPTWRWGIPPDAEKGVSSLLNWQFVLALTYAAELEMAVGEPELAARAGRLASELTGACTEAFWDDRRGLLADDVSRQSFSEHTQCMAVLSGQLDPEKRARIAWGLVEQDDIAQTTIGFTHYLFETYRALGLIDALLARLRLWYELVDRGFRTGFEMPEPSRSDCHGWSAHPIYHYFASILGIRPASSGFRTVRIEPQLGSLTSVKGSLVHPKGPIKVGLRREGDRVVGTVTLPEGLRGSFLNAGRSQPLRPGTQAVL